MEKVPRLLTAGLVIANLLGAGLALAPSVARAAEAEGLIAGTVFQQVGASLPGARITVTQILDDERTAGKVEERTATSDSASP